MQELTLKLTVDQTNLILEALGDMPFAKVYEVVNSSQSQASSQLQDSDQPVESDEEAEAS